VGRVHSSLREGRAPSLQEIDDGYHEAVKGATRLGTVRSLSSDGASFASLMRRSLQISTASSPASGMR
jgi:hypothetical protein